MTNWYIFAVPRGDDLYIHLNKFCTYIYLEFTGACLERQIDFINLSQNTQLVDT